MREYIPRIAYFYAQNESENKHSVGFTKQDVRKEDCHIEVQLRFPNPWMVSSGKICIYFEYQKKEIGICLGELTPKGGMLRWSGTLETANIENTGISLYQTKGIWIHLLNGTDYIAPWEERQSGTTGFLLFPNGGMKCVSCPKFAICEKTKALH